MAFEAEGLICVATSWGGHKHEEAIRGNKNAIYPNAPIIDLMMESLESNENMKPTNLYETIDEQEYGDIPLIEVGTKLRIASLHAAWLRVTPIQLMNMIRMIVVFLKMMTLTNVEMIAI